MIKILSILILLFVLVNPGFSQTISFPSDKGISTGNLMPMMINNELKGYYSFYFVGKGDGQLEWNLIIMDINFKITNDVPIHTDTKGYVKSIVFNGSAFCITYAETKLLQYLVYGTDGKFVRSYELDDMKGNQAEHIAFLGTYSVPYTGFVRNDFDENNDKYLEMFSNEGRVVWKIHGKNLNGNEKSPNREIINMISASDKYLLTSVTLLKLSDKELGDRSRSFYRVYDVKTGKELFEFNEKAHEEVLLLSGVNIDADEIILYGNYFKEGFSNAAANSWGGQKHGFYLQVIDSTGNLKLEYKNDGENDLAIIFKELEPKDFKESTLIWVHNAMKVKDKYYMIGEMYTSASKSINDMIVLELNATDPQPIVHVYRKDIVNLGGKSSLIASSNYNLGETLKQGGYFDYEFSAQNASHSMFSSVYANFDNSDRTDKNYVVGAIAMDRDQQLVNPKITLTSKPDEIRLFPGKPGYVAVVELFKKENSVTLTLHKFDF